MKIAIYVAIGRNWVIGNDGGLPWRLSTDLKRFKAGTMGKPIVMGRKTWESFPKRPLPGRQNIVITRSSDFRADGADVVTSFEDALTLARVRGRCDNVDEIAIIGGGEVYRQALPVADVLKVTHVMAAPDGDTSFPIIDPAEWERVGEEAVPAGEKDSHATLYAVYLRRKSVQ